MYKYMRPVEVQAYYNELCDHHMYNLMTWDDRLDHARLCQECQHSWYVTIPRLQVTDESYLKELYVGFDSEETISMTGPTWDVKQNYPIKVARKFRLENRHPKKYWTRYTDDSETAMVKAKLNEIKFYDDMHYPSFYSKLLPPRVRAYSWRNEVIDPNGPTQLQILEKEMLHWYDDTSSAASSMPPSPTIDPPGYCNKP